MNEVGPPRPPLSRAAPVLAVGLALVLAGGFAVGIFVGRKPPPDTSPAADQVLPPPAPASPPGVTAPVTLPVPQSAAPPPAPVVTPPPAPPVVAAPPPPAPAKPVPAAVPASKPLHESHPNRPVAPRARPKADQPKPEREVAAASPKHRREPAHALPKPAEGGGWIVQLGAFQSDDHAKLLVDTLAYHGHPARIAGGRDHNGHDWYFVQTPGYATRREAEMVARALRHDEHLPTYVFEAHHTP